MGFFGVMLGILISLKHIQNELHGKIKNLLMILIMRDLIFLLEKRTLARVKKKFLHERVLL